MIKEYNSMTFKEAAERIRDHMVVHKMRESHAVKITEALEMAVDLLLWAEQQPRVLFNSDIANIIGEYYDNGVHVGFARAKKVYGIKD